MRNVTAEYLCSKVIVRFDFPQQTLSTTASATPSANNANFCQLLSVTMLMPANPMFAPGIRVGVYNVGLSGEKRLGYAFVSLEKYLVDVC